MSFAENTKDRRDDESPHVGLLAVVLLTSLLRFAFLVMQRAVEGCKKGVAYQQNLDSYKGYHHYYET